MKKDYENPTVKPITMTADVICTSIETESENQHQQGDNNQTFNP